MQRCRFCEKNRFVDMQTYPRLTNLVNCHAWKKYCSKNYNQFSYNVGPYGIMTEIMCVVISVIILYDAQYYKNFVVILTTIFSSCKILITFTCFMRYIFQLKIGRSDRIQSERELTGVRIALVIPIGRLALLLSVGVTFLSDLGFSLARALEITHQKG